MPAWPLVQVLFAMPIFGGAESEEISLLRGLSLFPESFLRRCFPHITGYDRSQLFAMRSQYSEMVAGHSL
jgi:hypothetical protein